MGSQKNFWDQRVGYVRRIRSYRTDPSERTRPKTRVHQNLARHTRTREISLSASVAGLMAPPDDQLDPFPLSQINTVTVC
jgi:hypothetical protein